MFHFIERLRQKPEAERKMIAFSVAGVIAGVIFVLWLFSFLASLDEQSAQQQNTEVESFNLGELFNSFDEVFDAIQTETDTVKGQFNEFNARLESEPIDNSIDGLESEVEGDSEVFVSEPVSTSTPQ